MSSNELKDRSDEELVEFAAGGNRAAFETLLNRHYMTVYKIAYKCSGLKEDAEDITQNVLVKLASAIKSYKGDSKFTSWLYRITVNTSHDFYRKQKKNSKLEDIPEPASSDANQEDDIAANQIYRAISELPVKLKEAFLLVFDSDLNHAEAAKILGCAENTVSWRIFQARKKLKKILGNYNG